MDKARGRAVRNSGNYRLLLRWLRRRQLWLLALLFKNTEQVVGNKMFTFTLQRQSLAKKLQGARCITQLVVNYSQIIGQFGIKPDRQPDLFKKRERSGEVASGKGLVGLFFDYLQIIRHKHPSSTCTEGTRTLVSVTSDKTSMIWPKAVLRRV